MSALFADCVRCREPHGMLLYGEPTRHCNRCAHEVVEARGESIRALTADLATAIAERDALAETRAALTANLNALTIELGESRSELAEARRQLGEAETRIATYQAERDLACAALADTARERDALLDMARDVSVYAATSARHGSERSMRDVLTMTANRARSFLLPKSAHGAGEAK